MKPIEYCSESYEAEKSLAEFVITSADATTAFDPREEIFDDMAMSIERLRIIKFDATGFAGRNAKNSPDLNECLTEYVKTKAPIGSDPTMSEYSDQRGKGVKVMSISGHQVQADRAAKPINDRRQFRVLSSLGFADGLHTGSAGGVGAVLMNFDVGTIDTSQGAASFWSKLSKHLRPHVAFAPSAKTRIDRIPRAKVFRQISPRHSSSQDVINPTYHYPIVFRRSASNAVRRHTACASVIRPIFLSAPRADQVSLADLMES